MLFEFSCREDSSPLLQAVKGVLYENLRMVFLRRLLRFSLSFQKLVLSLGECIICRLRINLEGGRGLDILCLACVSIQPLISQETTFLLVEGTSNQKFMVLSGEVIQELTDIFNQTQLTYQNIEAGHSLKKQELFWAKSHSNNVKSRLCSLDTQWVFWQYWVWPIFEKEGIIKYFIVINLHHYLPSTINQHHLQLILLIYHCRQATGEFIFGGVKMANWGRCYLRIKKDICVLLINLYSSFSLQILSSMPASSSPSFQCSTPRTSRHSSETSIILRWSSRSAKRYRRVQTSLAVAKEPKKPDFNIDFIVEYLDCASPQSLVFGSHFHSNNFKQSVPTFTGITQSDYTHANQFQPGQTLLWLDCLIAVQKYYQAYLIEQRQNGQIWFWVLVNLGMGIVANNLQLIWSLYINYTRQNYLSAILKAKNQTKKRPSTKNELYWEVGKIKYQKKIIRQEPHCPTERNPCVHSSCDGHTPRNQSSQRGNPQYSSSCQDVLSKYQSQVSCW